MENWLVFTERATTNIFLEGNRARVQMEALNIHKVCSVLNLTVNFCNNNIEKYIQFMVYRMYMIYI